MPEGAVYADDPGDFVPLWIRVWPRLGEDVGSPGPRGASRTHLHHEHVRARTESLAFVRVSSRDDEVLSATKSLDPLKMVAEPQLVLMIGRVA